MKQVPGIIDLTVFGGTTRQYQTEIDSQKLLQYNVTLPQVIAAVQNSSSNTGGSAAVRIRIDGSDSALGKPGRPKPRT